MTDSPRESLSTPELVARAQRGDRSAFDVLVQRSSYRLSSLVFLRMSEELAVRAPIDDVIQEVWLRAWDSIGRFEWRGEGSFFRWVGGIADHVVRDLSRFFLKSTRSREISVDPEVLPHLAAFRRGDGSGRKGSPTPSEALRRDERFERLRRALDRLGKEHREVIILARLRGLSMGEIAEKIDRTPAAASALLLRAMRRLREHFGTTESFHLPDRSLDSGSGDEEGRAPVKEDGQHET